MTTRASRGIVTVTSLRLCSRAPETMMESWRGIHNPVYVAPGPGRPGGLSDDAELRALRARHVAGSVAGADHEAVGPGPQGAALEPAREVDRVHPGDARLGEAALERDPAPAAKAGAVAVDREPAAAGPAQGAVLLDGERDARGFAEPVDDRCARAH